MKKYQVRASKYSIVHYFIVSLNQLSWSPYANPSFLTLLLTIACSAGTKPLSDSWLSGESDRPVWDPDPQTIDNGSSSSTVSLDSTR